MKTIFSIAALILTVLAFQFEIYAQKKLAEADFSLRDVRSLEIRGGFCNVEMQGHEGAVVEFEGYIRGTGNSERYEIRHEQRDGHVEVWVESPLSVWGNLESLLKFRVPPDVEIEVENSSGNLRVTDVSTRTIRLETSSGNIRTGDTSGKMTVECTSGNATVEGQTGNLQVTTTSGNIRLDGIRGNVESEATSGNIHLDNIAGLVTAQCSSGNITMNTVRGSLYAETTSGNIHGDRISLEKEGGFKATSGNIRLNLLNPMDELSFDLEAGSGRLNAGGNSGEDEMILNRGPVRVRGVTGSGNQTYNTR